MLEFGTVQDSLRIIVCDVFARVGMFQQSHRDALILCRPHMSNLAG